jgi:hypothetical protein
MFLHPWALAFAAAVGIPIAVHFLTRPRPVALPISTLRFVREAIRQRRAHHRLRDFLLLLLRTVAILLIVLAVARPRKKEQSLVAEADNSEAVRVVLLDSSLSLDAVEGGSRLFERARAIAAERLRYRPGLRANVILAGARPHAVFDQPSLNFDALRDELSRANVRPEQLDVARALSAAADMLAPESPDDLRRRELVIVSDFQRANWARADFSVLPTETQIQLESVAPPKALANLAVAGVRVVGQGSERSGRLEVDVGNWSATSRQVTVEVSIGDATRRVIGSCPAGRLTTLTDELAALGDGWHIGKARLSETDDALPNDDALDVVVEVRPPPTYVLVTRQPATMRPSSSHFVECALAPEKELAKGNVPRIVRTTADALDVEQLNSADLIVLDHPGELQEAARTMLIGLLRRGRPLWYITAESVDAVNLQRLSEAMGRGLHMPVAFQPPGQGQWRRDLFLTTVKYDARPFAVLGESAPGLMRGLRFGGGLVSRPLPDSLADDVLATYNDGSACLVVTTSEVGSVAILNADLGVSNLPAHEAFVPIVDDLTQQLTERRTAPTAIHCGQPLVVRLPMTNATRRSLTIERPSDSAAEQDLGELQDEASGPVWHWSSVGEPGVYRVLQGSDLVFALAVTVPPEESQLESLSEDVLKQRLAAGRAIFFRSAAEEDQTRDMWWTWLAVGCVLSLLGEVATLLVFRT